MAEGPIPQADPAQPGPLKKSSFEHLIDVLDIFSPKFGKARHAINEKVPPIKMGWYVIATFGLFAVAMYLWGELHVQKKDFETKVENLRTRLEDLRADSMQWKLKSQRVDDLDHRINDLNLQLVRAESERDKAREKLAPFELRAAQLFTNELPTEALNQLLKEIREMDSFDVRLNGIRLTNRDSNMFQTVAVGPEGQISLTVSNVGRFPLKDIVVYFNMLKRDETNLIAVDWVRGGHSEPFIMGETNRVSLWRSVSDAPLGQKGNWEFPLVSIATNAFKTEFSGQTVGIPIALKTFSQHSEFRLFPVMLTYQVPSAPAASPSR